MRFYRCFAVALLTMITLAGCRSVRPEAGLPPSAFEGLLPRVVSNDRGFWFLVTDSKTETQPFVAIGEGAQRELYYAIKKGSRTYRLMPLTPFAYDSLDQLRDERVEPRFVATPAELGEELPDIVGWMAKADAAPTWAGRTPPDDTSVMLVAGVADDVPKLSQWFLGTAVVRDGKLVSKTYDETPTGPVIALPDGARPTRPIRAALAGLDIKPIDGVEFSSTQVDVQGSSPFVTRPAALRAGVDALVMAADGRAAQITLTRPILRSGLPLSITDEPITLGREEVEQGLLALRDVANGRDLAAVKRFLKIQVASGTNLIAGRMRVLELLAAAGYVDWTRNAMIANVQGLGPDAAFYLSRSHFVAGDFHRAADFADRAAERFGVWPEPDRSHGYARARLISSRLAAMAGEWDVAFDFAIEASESFMKAGDDMRAAEAELLAAHFALNGQDLTRAVQAGALARSRFFHGASPYHAAFAELALADIYARAGEAGEAQKMTEFAALRFDELADPIGRNRARIANGRAVSVDSPAQGVRDLEIGLENAQTAGDFVGVVDAAASLVVLGSAPKDATASYGLVIAAGLARTEDPYVRERAAQALSLLCSRGMAESVDQITGASPRDIAVAKAACSTPTQERSDDMVGSLIAQGWAAWRAGNIDEAAIVAGKLEKSITDELRQSAPRQAAEALFFAAVVDREIGGARANDLALQGVRLLGDHIDPTRIAAVLDEMAAQYVNRGQVWLAGDLLRAAAVNAQDQGQTELRRELAVRRVEVLHGGGDYDGALAAIYDAQPALESAGPGSQPALARLFVLQQDSMLRLGRAADAAVAQKKVGEIFSNLEPLPQVELVLLQGQLAASRGDGAGATAALTRATRLEAALADGLATDEQRKLLRARIKLARADAALSSGAVGEAANLYVESLDAVADLGSTAEVLAFRVAGLRGLGLSTANAERLASAVTDLEEVRGVAVAKFPTVAPAATAALVSLEIAAGRPSPALEVVEAAKLDGQAVAPNPIEAQCLEARASGLSGKAGAVGLLERCATKSVGDTRADARLLAVLADSQATAADKNRKARELAADDKDLSKRAAERLKYVSELAAGTTKRDDDRENRLMAALEKAADRGRAKDTVRAIEDVVEYFIATGQASRATPLIDENSSTFYDLGDNGPGALARLRAEAGVGTLQAVAGYAFASRAIAETPDLSPSDEAGLLFANARHAVVMGMWQAARTDLAAARDAASKDRGLRQRIDAFARRFSL